MSRRPRGDSGQGMLPLVVLVSFSLIIIMVSLLVPWGAATTEKAQAQTAADAAALAAVDSRRRAWLDLTAPGLLRFPDVAGPRVSPTGTGGWTHKTSPNRTGRTSRSTTAAAAGS